MLEHFLSALLHDQSDSDPLSPRPCEHFDLICGTGSGALLAILLGRFKMRCDEAGDVYDQIGRLMFELEEGSGEVRTRVDRGELRKALEKLVDRKFGNPNAPMKSSEHNEEGHVCHVSSFKRYSTQVPSYNDLLPANRAADVHHSIVSRLDGCRCAASPRSHVPDPCGGCFRIST